MAVKCNHDNAALDVIFYTDVIFLNNFSEIVHEGLQIFLALKDIQLI